MAFALVASVTAEGSSTGATSSGIDTTGANLITISVGSFNAAVTVSDSKSNTYTKRTPRVNASSGIACLYDCLNPTVGTGHTFTVSGTGIYAGLVASAFSGAHATASFDVENGAVGASATTYQPGSITPSVDGSLVVFAGPAGGASSNLSAVSVGTIAGTTVGTSSTDYSIGLAYYVQTTAASINPTLTTVSATVWSGVIASYKPAAGASGDGVGSGTSVATGSGIGASLNNQSGSGISVATGSGIGAALISQDGSGTSVANGTGIGASLFAGYGNGISVATGLAVGASLFAGIGSGISVSTGDGVGTYSSVGTSSGSGISVSTGIAIGASLFNATGTGISVSNGIAVSSSGYTLGLHYWNGSGWTLSGY